MDCIERGQGFLRNEPNVLQGALNDEPMDEGTLKTPIPTYRLYWSVVIFVWGGVAIL